MTVSEMVRLLGDKAPNIGTLLPIPISGDTAIHGSSGFHNLQL